jgi:4-amino-4-deoxy-L-arabinose transferase-like glycosyltransferase
MKVMRRYRYMILILLLAIFLRFWQLGVIPQSLNWDEVAFGYNAYAIGIDGKDEFGQFLPYKYLESYGDFKPPLYAYVSVIPIKIFGLNEFSTRFASALFGSFTVLATYFLTKTIFYSAKRSEAYALFAMLLLAISPWHVNLSRAAYEANVATFFIVLGVLLLLLSLRQHRYLLIFSAISFALSFYTFNTSRVVVPLLVTGLVIGNYKELIKMTRWVLAAGFVGLVLLLPIFSFLTSPQAELRFKEVNIFSNQELVATANQQVSNDNGAFWSRILHNRRVVFAQEYLKHYFDNLNPNFLFISGDENHRFGTKDVGLLYIWELPFIVVGSIVLLRRHEGKWWVLPVWLVVGLIPAATARETPHALRIETIIPVLQIISALGVVMVLDTVIKWHTARKVKRFIIFAIFLMLFVNVMYFLHGYFKHYGSESAGDWQYGYKEAVLYADEKSNEYELISMTNKIGRPYAYVLFFTKEDPTIFRNTATIDKDVFGFVNIKAYDKYRFAAEVRDGNTMDKKTLYIDVPENVPDGVTRLKEFRYPDGYLRLVAYE